MMLRHAILLWAAAPPRSRRTGMKFSRTARPLEERRGSGGREPCLLARWNCEFPTVHIKQVGGLSGVESNPITLCGAAFPPLLQRSLCAGAPRGKRSGAGLADNGCCSLLFTCNRSMRGWCTVTVVYAKGERHSSSFRRKANTMRLTIVSPPFCGTVSKSDQYPSKLFHSLRAVRESNL